MKWVWEQYSTNCRVPEQLAALKQAEASEIGLDSVKAPTDCSVYLASSSQTIRGYGDTEGYTQFSTQDVLAITTEALR